MTIHPAAQGFANNSDEYEEHRPSYAPEAVAHIVATLGLGRGRTVVDVAAGTGKLTRALLESGAAVIAVEPVAEMRAKLADTAPGATAVVGTAEDLPLPDGGADGITVAQAFHWFDGPAALAEFHRVLAPGGGLAVVFNKREAGVDWLRAVNVVMDPYRHGAPHHDRGDWRDAFTATTLFTPLEDVMFDNPHVLSREATVGRFRSLSFAGTLSAADLADMTAGIEHVLATHPDTKDRDHVVIPQRTVVSSCRRI